MERILVQVYREDVYEDVGKETDYFGSKLTGDEQGEPGRERDRILMADADLETLERFWDEGVAAINERLKELLVYGRMKSERRCEAAESECFEVSAESGTERVFYEAEFEVGRMFNRELTADVEALLRGYLADTIAGRWLRLCHREEWQVYIADGESKLEGARRMLYSRRRPATPECV